ncbi:MAG: hypothetical protein NHB15_13125 [Methanosarcina barkeri]|nr:hypothetical protein [Methanosarcina sp. ERenArc_MAG2]
MAQILICCKWLFGLNFTTDVKISAEIVSVRVGNPSSCSKLPRGNPQGMGL